MRPVVLPALAKVVAFALLGLLGLVAPVAAQTLAERLATAIDTGVSANVTEAELRAELLRRFAATDTQCTTLLTRLYPGNAGMDNFAMPEASVYVKSQSLDNTPLHTTGGGSRTYAEAGQRGGNGSRYVVFGADMLTDPVFATESRKAFSKRLFAWLLDRPANADVATEAYTLLARTDAVATALGTWLAANGISGWSVSTDAARLDTGNYELYVTDFESPHVGYLDKAFGDNKPVLAVSFNYGQQASDKLAQFGLTVDGWNGATITGWDSVDALCAASPSYQRTVGTMLKTLDAGVPDIDYSSCKTVIGNTTCSGRAVSAASAPTFNLQTDMLDGADAVNSEMRALDAAKTSAFDLGPSRDHTKLLVLYAEKIRAAVTYPFDKESISDTAFYTAWFANKTVNRMRINNLAQADLGNFSPPAADFAGEARVTRTRSFTPSQHDEWTAVGLYAPPGERITVERVDGTLHYVEVRPNIVRRGSTRRWNNNGMRRPFEITGEGIPLEAGESVSFSLPFGGPLYVYAEKADPGAQAYEVRFTNVIEHPFLDVTDGVDDAEFLAFENKLRDSTLGWYDIKTPIVEVHERMALGRDRLLNYEGGMRGYIADLRLLLLNNYWITGRIGAGIPARNPEIEAFCLQHGLNCDDETVHGRPKVQHMNGDTSICGYACAGNPIDLSGGVSPLGRLESHELGHNLQAALLKLYGSRVSEASNEIFITYTQVSKAVRDGLEYYGAHTNHSSAYEQVQQSIALNLEPNRDTHPIWRQLGRYQNTSVRQVAYIQLIYKQGSWDFLTKLYLLMREFVQARRSDTQWQAQRDGLYFSTYSRSEANAVDPQDFMYIVASCHAREDYAAWLRAWGVATSSRAARQARACGATEPTAMTFYHIDSNRSYAEFPGVASNILPLDGFSAYFDPDTDNDRLRNEVDPLPTDPTNAVDSDGDGVGDALDDDDDNDGASDAFEEAYGFDPLDPTDGALDPDSDGATNAEESAAGTEPREPSSRPIAPVDRWLVAPAMNTARSNHTATRLADDQVLVAGGLGVEFEPTGTAETFSPLTLAWTPTGELLTARVGHTATRLDDGSVLVSGGLGIDFAALDSAERYSTTTGSWTATGAMVEPREEHTATLLPDGRVLVTGGRNDDGALASAELFDPLNNAWQAAGSLTMARSGHSATRLVDGRVLVSGGGDNNGALRTVEIYDPTTGVWNSGADMNEPHNEHNTTMLADGRVLVAGGTADGAARSGVEVYDPATDQWTLLSALNVGREDHATVLLPNGSVLVTGGSDGTADLASVERYDPGQDRWLGSTGALPGPRSQHTATVLGDGRVLFTGGLADFEPVSGVALYAY